MSDARKIGNAPLDTFQNVFLWCTENTMTEKPVCVGIIYNSHFMGLKQIVLQVPVLLVPLTQGFTAVFLHPAGSKKYIRPTHTGNYSRLKVPPIH